MAADIDILDSSHCCQ